MELRRLTICMTLLVLAISHCSEAHSMHRRQAVDDVNYDDTLLGDEASDDEALNDTENTEPVKETTPATIETAPTQYEIRAGEDVRLHCKVTPEKGTVVAWHRNNQQYFIGTIPLHPEEDRYAIAEDSKDLLIRNAQAEDTGVFRCEIVQTVPVAINHTLMVLQKPVIINMTSSNSGVLVSGDDLVLTCYITAFPVPTVLWSVVKVKDQNVRLTEKDAEFRVEGNLYTMIIKNVKREDSGSYYCYALNTLGSSSAEAAVVVNSKPQVHVAKTIVNSDLQIEAVLQCVAHGEPRPHIRWYKDGSLIENSASKYVISTQGAHSNLTVSPSVDQDFGTYTCESENAYGIHNRSIDLVQSPVIEDLDVDGPKMSWTVHSHQPVEKMEVQLKPTNGDVEWTVLDVPLPEGRHHKYDISFTLEDKQLQPGEYLANVKVRNSKSWGGTDEPAVVTIQNPQSLYIQTASVISESNAHSIRPVYTVLTTVLMYLLVRML